jgi:hypothetical protein
LEGVVVEGKGWTVLFLGADGDDADVGFFKERFGFFPCQLPEHVGFYFWQSKSTCN